MRSDHIIRNGIVVLKSLTNQISTRLETMQHELDESEKGMRPKYIILHHSLTADSATVSWRAIHKYHADKLGRKDIGYHFGIERVKKNYEILIGRMMNVYGAHCLEEGMDHKSLGICFIGNYDLMEPSKEMWELGLRLVGSLIQIFGIPVENVKGHSDYASYKSCPGKMFSVRKFRQSLKEN